LSISIFVHKNSHFLFLSFKFALSQIDLAKFSDEESRQAMTRFSMILQDQESVNFAQEFQETCRGWTFWFSLQLWTDLSLAKTQLKLKKSYVFCLFLFLKPARRSLTHFSPLSAHAQHCDNSEPQTDLDRRS
jgi:hypothetical protein